MKRILPIIFLTIVNFVSLAQNSGESLSEQISDLYKAQEYKQMINICEQQLSEGQQSAYLLYNLGNAYFKDGNMPKAIVNYERAALLAPNDSDIQHNLSFAYAQQPDNIEHVSLGFVPRLYQKMYRLCTVDVWAGCSLIFLVLLCVSLCLFLFADKLSIRKISLVTMICGFLFGLTSFFFAQSRYSELTSHEYAIVMEPTTSIKTEPMTTSMDLATIHGGIKVKITDEAFGWYKVQLGNGKEGWILTQYVERI
ncbi:MAG: SH3 domain-containing protein [Bacteroidales bacterium]|nr:SH3 domain-containing protein [Bacteroidales bacterium]